MLNVFSTNNLYFSFFCSTFAPDFGNAHRCSASTNTYTALYGVLLWNAAAKLLLFFDIRKIFEENNQFCIKITQNMAFNRTLITAALPYANGPVHIGHLAGVYVPADIYARYLRLKGKEVLFVCGSDEHGVPVTIRARKEGITTQQVVDRYHELIKRSFADFGVSFDIYSRTTSAIHHRFAADYFRAMYEAGQFEEETSEQFYDPETGHFLTDRNIRGECPRCHSMGAYGDQCEKCGATLSPDELINPYNAETGNPLTKKATKHWYLPLDKYQAWLEDWILNNHKEWRPNVYGQCKSWLDGGLKPRAVTRDLDWGIPVPVEGAEGKVLYVWFDAPIGYISNTKELCDAQPDKYGPWEKWWKQDDTRMIHFIGKDNIVFHCIVFPAMLKAQGYNLPDNVPSNEFLNLEGDKISTSRNWAVWLNEYLDDFPGKQDVLRYVLTANAPETKDNDFTWADFQARNNNELVAIYGNFINRALVLTGKYFEGRVPACGELTDYDKATIEDFKNVKATLEELLEAFRFRDAQKEAMNLARIGNKYLADTEPWKLAKTDMSRTATVLHLALQIAANLAIAFEPFLPFSSEKLKAMLRLNESTGWEDLGRIDLLPEGQPLGEISLLFEKIEDSAIQAQLDRLERIKKENEEAAKAEALKNWRPEPVKETTTIDEFDKTDIRVATVLECTPVKKSDRLLQFKLDDGMGGRTILSGIAQSYPDPSVLVGKQVLYIANFPPRKMMGIESQGMILSAVDADGKLVVTTVSAPVKNGSAVG
ncbi:MAG: methionine--tRNA ligase [Paludibacteraceae bacterium]|nr:methionine--tRNA ligase [Paludibacteraceae bacterium]